MSGFLSKSRNPHIICLCVDLHSPLQTGHGPLERLALAVRVVRVAQVADLRALGTIGAGFADELGSGAKIAVEAIEQTRVDILDGMGDTANDVVMAFEGLSDNVKGATYAELARAYVPRLPPADEADVEEFAETSAGKLLIPEWGADAGHKLAVALFRWERLVTPLTESEFAEIDDFYRRRLRPRERAGILKRLAL